MLIYFGTRGALKKDISTGIDYCPNCGKFTGWYAGRNVKIWHICFIIPLMTKTLNFFHMCGVCQHGQTIERADYFQLKEMHKPFKKRSQQIKFFEKAAKLAETMPPGDMSVQTIVSQLSPEYPICATPRLETEYRRRLGVLLALRGLKDPNSSSLPTFPQPGVMAELPAQQNAPREMDTI